MTTNQQNKFRHCEEGALPDEAISNIVGDCFAPYRSLSLARNDDKPFMLGKKE